MEQNFVCVFKETVVVCNRLSQLGKIEFGATDFFCETDTVVEKFQSRGYV